MFKTTQRIVNINIMKVILTILGIISLGLGVLGIFLPVLPTTPLLLLAAALFLKSNRNLYDWLLNHRVLGRYISNFIKYKAIPLRVKIVSVSAVWITLLYCAIFVSDHWAVRLMFILLATGITIHILSYKTLKMDVTIRSACKNDAETIAQIVAMAIGDAETMENYCGKNYMDVLTEIAMTEDTQYSYRNALIAEVGNRIAGALVGYDGSMLYPLRNNTIAIIHKYNPSLTIKGDETQDGEYYIDSLGVFPEFRGMGAGRKLLMAAQERAAAEGHSRAGLIVDYNNPGAEKLYISSGFRRAGTKVFFSHQMWHLQKTVAGS